MSDQEMKSVLSVNATLSLQAFLQRVINVLSGNDIEDADDPLEQALRLFMSRYSPYSAGYLVSHLGRAMMDWHIHSVLSETKEKREDVWLSIDATDNDLIDMTVFMPLPENCSRCSDYFDHRLTGESRAIYLSYEAVPEGWSMASAERE